MKKKILLIVAALAATLCLCFGIVACGEEPSDVPADNPQTEQNGNGEQKPDDGQGGNNGNGGNTNPSGNGGTTTPDDENGGNGEQKPDDNQENTPSVQEFTITYDANGGTFGDDGGTVTQTVKEGEKLTAPASPARSNYTFAGWAKNKDGSEMWKFHEDTVTENITLYAKWTQESAVILSVEGASIEGESIFMFVEKDITSVSLAKKVVCSADSGWRLYSDPDGKQEIATRMANNLQDGDNTYYIVVASTDGVHVNTYVLTIHRSYAVNVDFYFKNEVIEKETAYTGVEFNVTYTPSLTGYTFNYWKDGEDSKTEKLTPWGDVSLYADATAKTYTASLDVDNGDALQGGKEKQTMTYDSEYSFPVPTRTGYTFTGWYQDDAQVTDGEGRSFEAWTYDGDKTFTAHWEADNYTVTLTQSDEAAGSVSGGEAHAYDSQVTITATTNAGYIWVGWYKDGERVTENAEYTFQMGFDVTYEARWCKVTVTSNNSDAGSVTELTNTYKAGEQVTITATTNMGYTWVGWYLGEKEVTTELSYEFTMPKENVTYEARWCKVTVTNNNSDAGSVTELTNTYKTGDEVTITATTNKGYTFEGWYQGEEQVAISETYQFTMGKENVTYEAKWTYVEGMKKFIFTSTPTTCKITGLKDKSATEITVPECVTSIGERAFASCYELTSIVIPNSVSSIGERAFASCYELTSIVIPNSVSSIGDSAFSNCSGLTSVTIGNGVTSIGKWAFDDCSGLQTVYYGGTVEQWEAISIGDYNSALSSATRYYYSATNPYTTNPNDSDNYWHYDDDGVTPVIWKKD